MGTLILCICSAFFGYIFCALFSINPDKDEFGASIQFDESELQRHDLHLSIPKDLAIKEPDETIEKVKREFVWQIMDNIQDNIVIEEDQKRHAFKYTVSVWTKDIGGSR